MHAYIVINKKIMLSKSLTELKKLPILHRTLGAAKLVCGKHEKVVHIKIQEDNLFGNLIKHLNGEEVEITLSIIH